MSILAAIAVVASTQAPEGEAFAKSKSVKKSARAGGAAKGVAALSSAATPAAAAKGVPGVPDPDVNVKGSKPGSAECGFYSVGGNGKSLACTSAQTCCITTEYNRDNLHCEDTKGNRLNCGGCGLKCATGLECHDGLCAPPAGSILCEGQWIDGRFDFENCGACGNKCKGLCTNGKCTSCDKGETICDNGYGDRRCRNLKNDAGNCGKCFHDCPGDWDCKAGRCVP
jgi:hypothetical protein